MIKEFEFYHGVVFARILHAVDRAISIKPFPTPDNASYVIDNKIGIYIKYSEKRLSPWRFSFQKRHQDEILEMKNKFEEIYLLLVCNDDGIVALNFGELKHILNEVHNNTEWISAARGKRQMYTIKGSDGKLEFKIGHNDFPSKLFIDAVNLSK
ncbi:hypothetical protein KGQ24_01000 [Patescibacteria group bacterium]|nr:hypothetical protein [Patescibacteria group bacterium]